MKRRLSRRSLLCAAATYHAMLSAAEDDVMTGAVHEWRSIVRNKSLTPAFEYLDKTDWRSLPLGRHPIDGDRMYITLSQAITRAMAGEKFEAHRKYADIHLLISGEEIIGSARPAGMKVATPYDEQRDIEMYAQPADFRHLRMAPGDFVVFLPGQGHLPGCHEQTAVQIRKAVIKVLMA